MLVLGPDGRELGTNDSSSDGSAIGDCDRVLRGFSLEDLDGKELRIRDGVSDARSVGYPDGRDLGSDVGSSDGVPAGDCVGLFFGLLV